MARINTGSPTPCFWNCVGIGICFGSAAIAWSIIRGNAVEIEAANYKLKTNKTIVELQQVSDTLEQSARTLPIANSQRDKIERELKDIDAVLDQAETEIERETEQLIIDTQINE